MTVKEMQIIRSSEIIGGSPTKEEIKLKVDCHDTSWQATSLGRIRTDRLTVSENGQHISLPIEYEPSTLGEPGKDIRTRNIQLDSKGRGKEELKSNNDIQIRTLYVDIGNEIPKPIPEILRPYEV